MFLVNNKNNKENVEALQNLPCISVTNSIVFPDAAWVVQSLLKVDSKQAVTGCVANSVVDGI